MIAPHKGLEIKMVLSGVKPFAVIEKRKDSAQYHYAGAIEKSGITIAYRDGLEGSEVIVTNRRASIAEYDALLLDGIARLGLKNYHRSMGALFGYAREEIENFISSAINCNCSKCGGNKT